MDNNSVKENIIRRRKVRRLSQQEVADKIGLSRTAYRNIEKGETRLLSENIVRIADVLGVGTEELVLGYAPDRNADGSIRDENSYHRLYEDLKEKFDEQTRRHVEEVSRLNSEIATLLETRANNALATWLVAFRRRQREESANPIQEEEAIGEERETVAETSVYDAAMQVNCVHSIRVVSHNLTVTPPVADTKKLWFDSLLVVE